MSQLSDKDFDKLFSEAFENFNEEPSAKVWFSVENDLERQRLAGRKIRLAQWSIAASVVLCLVAGALFLTNKQQLKGDSIVSVGNNDPNPDKEIKSRAVIIQSPKAQSAQPAEPGTETKEQKTAPVRKKTPAKNKVKADVEMSDTRLAQVSNTEPSFIQAKNSTGAIPSDQCIPVVEPKLLHQALIASNDATDEGGIPTIGDALNYIAAKVDKRDKKFLAINKKSSSFSLNLGVIKFERKRQAEEEEEQGNSAENQTR
ncbi:hypothetical protein NF867_06330 [Solitalea sp. MAHUQ-68]|uniref:Uncharacterized protein n=1 Tax=Solitalea agri TaxID=2953739 RepID=A0A9X2F1K6_9SPHI|nr:hypothetical protein [Solitalea agri]MCO4292470.1 hypothetical protein [Solitalea agri]